MLVGVVVGGIDRLWTATLGGFTIGFATGHHQRRAADRQDGVPPVGRFLLVILVLLLAGGALHARPPAAVERV